MKDITRALYEATGKAAKKIIHEQAEFFEELCLSSEHFPEYCMEVILEVLSVEELYEKPGIEAIVLKTTTDAYRLTDHQKEKLLSAINEHYAGYESENMCWSICDFIARSYDQRTALIFFEQQFPKSSKEGKQGVALGLDILGRSARHDSNLTSHIQLILASGTHS